MPQPPTAAERARAWVGLDVSKTHHHATVLDDTGTVRVARRVANTQGDLEELIRQASSAGEVVLVIDQPGSIAQIISSVSQLRNSCAPACAARSAPTKRRSPLMSDAKSLPRAAAPSIRASSGGKAR